MLSPGAPPAPEGAAQKRQAERRELLAALPSGAVCAEIGTWRGDFAELILRDRQPRELLLIDAWEHRGEDAYEDASYGGRMEGGQQALDEMHAAVSERFAAEIARGQVRIVRMRSTEAAATLAPASLDWVYVDGDHSYEGVKADLEAFFEAVKPGGLIAGDDYGHEGSWFGDGVQRAVEEFAPRCAGLQVIGTQFVLRKAA